MKPPTKEEEEMAEEIVDDGFGLQFDNKDPWSIQEALDVFLRGLAIFEACHKENIEIWTSWDINQRINIRDLVDNLNETLEWVSVIMFQDSVVINTPSERAENLYRAINYPFNQTTSIYSLFSGLKHQNNLVYSSFYSFGGKTFDFSSAS
jgi:hypothetical protein